MTASASFVLPVDKPVGPTSHDVVAGARRALGIKRIGHTGTLDPFASGLMLLCVGDATRIAEYLTDLPKSYHAIARLDGRTLTDDNTSEVFDTTEQWRGLSTEQIGAALQDQVGDILQMPPQYSAKKIAGERAYDIARRGDVATFAAVPVHIDRITLRGVRLPEIEFEVTCGSGTYIRAIARDLGAALGTGGYLTQLRRTQVGIFSAAAAVPLAELQDREQVERAALRPADAVSHIPALELSEEQERSIRFGQAIQTDNTMHGTIRLTRNDRLVAIAEIDAGRIRPRKVMADA